MNKPFQNKSEGMKQSIEMVFPGTLKAVEEKRCPVCMQLITEFRDALSKKEYSISGMYQDCQDKVFGV